MTKIIRIKDLNEININQDDFPDDTKLIEITEAFTDYCVTVVGYNLLSMEKQL